MKAYVNGKIVELTEAEEKEFIEEIKKLHFKPTVTNSDRISALESAIADLAIMMAMGGAKDA